MDDPNPQPPPPEGPLSVRLLAAAALLAALAEVALAFTAHLFAQKGYCPVEIGHGAACAPLIRPRLAALGPLSVSQIALVGSVLSAGLCGLLAFRIASEKVQRASAAVLAGGAGIAVGLQALPQQALESGASCPVCLGVMVAALAVAGLYALASRLRVSARVPLVALVISLVLVTPLAALRGQAIKAEDERRSVAVEKVGGSTGPRIIFVSRPGCPYCEALRLDVLGDPAVLALLGKTRGVVVAREFDPRVKALLRVPVVPTLIAIAADGTQIGEPVIGLQPVATVETWLTSIAGR